MSLLARHHYLAKELKADAFSSDILRMSQTRFQQLLSNRNLYLNIPNLKLAEAQFLLENVLRTNAAIRNLANLSSLRPLVLELSYFADSFFASSFGFFDTLAIYHTRNRLAVYDKVHFYSWLQYQISRSPTDMYLQALEREDTRWISELRRNRNIFVHNSQALANFTQRLRISGQIGSPISTEGPRVELCDGDSVEIATYCNALMVNVRSLLDLLNANIEKEYDYMP
ncbi:MAG: hypothetical protein ACYCQJ_04945 [Nitrososphaerales archaeon]